MGMHEHMGSAIVSLQEGVKAVASIAGSLAAGMSTLSEISRTLQEIDKKLAHFRTIARRWEDAQPGPRATTPDELAAWGFDDITLLDREHTGPAVGKDEASKIHPDYQPPSSANAPTSAMPVGLPKWEDL